MYIYINASIPSERIIREGVIYLWRLENMKLNSANPLQGQQQQRGQKRNTGRKKEGEDTAQNT